MRNWYRRFKDKTNKTNKTKKQIKQIRQKKITFFIVKYYRERDLCCHSLYFTKNLICRYCVIYRVKGGNQECVAQLVRALVL